MEITGRLQILCKVDCIYFFNTIYYNLYSQIRLFGVKKGTHMKILIITNHSYMLYRFRCELIAELQKHHEVVLIMPFLGHEDDFQAMGLRCINTNMDRRGVNPATDFRLLRTYRRLIKSERPDLVITYSIKPNIYAGFICSILKIPFCANVQGLGTAFQRRGIAQFVTLLYTISLRKAKTVFFENVGNAREFINRRIVHKDKITVLSGAGLNLEKYPLVAQPDNDGFRFLYLGRIMKEKGINELCYAIRKLYAEFGKKVQLDLVGFFDDDCEEQVKALVDDGIAVFHGFQTDPIPYYSTADCVVLPSYHEGMSNVLLEASAIGRPVITSNIHGCKEAVDDGVSGLLCRVKDSEDLYACMHRMISFSKAQRLAMGLAARQKIEREFDKKIVVSKTIEAIFN